ncbi:major facilitator superfamily domain-containing protein [Truncatella angustata]|uniref:Major facilitator superfamily domain-containing protein n=1 Tax=Truncatella angustata TaxID=152316 RepID=A0A9P8UI35_9PEZI|nr:major facilitator superfamily domain-containing protein [Truncatella angustata]KAH6652536.1 major facilitator superfamily domain-containing protein [Truncatella angustata]
METRPQIAPASEPERNTTTEKDGELKAPEFDLSHRPDGGITAWLQVLSAWCVVFSTFGLVNCFGVYQTYYEQVLLPSSSSSSISWIGSIQGFLLLAGGLFSGPLFDMGYFRHLLCSGLFLIIFGQFMTSLCTEYYQVLLAQGICIGLGCALCFSPSTAILSQYFSRRIALATGIGSSGSPVAGAVLPIAFNQLVSRIGFGWATRVIAFILMGVAVIPLLFFKTRLPPSKHRRALVDMSALTDVTYMTFVIGGFFAFLGLYVPFFYIELFTVDHGLASSTFAPYMVSIMNAASVFGRVVPGVVSDFTGLPTMVMAGCALLSCVLSFAWIGIRNFGGSVVFAILYGAFSGGVVSSQPTGIFSLTSDHSRIGTRLGMGCFIAGVALLIGTPIAGAMLGTGTRESSWEGLIGFSATAMFLGGCLLLTTGMMVYLRLRRKIRDQL